MDGFDDLLDSSNSNPILDNPFEDPFARPRSPDPWLAFSQQTVHDQGQITEHAGDPPSPIQHKTQITQHAGGPPSPIQHKTQITEHEGGTLSPVQDLSHIAEHAGGPLSPVQHETHISEHAGGPLSPVQHETHIPERAGGPLSSLQQITEHEVGPLSTVQHQSQIAEHAGGPLSSLQSGTQITEHEVGPLSTVQHQSQITEHAGGPPSSLQHETQITEHAGGPLSSVQHVTQITEHAGGPLSSVQYQSQFTEHTGGPLSSVQHDTQILGDSHVGDSGGWGDHENGDGFVNGTQRRDDVDDDDDDLPIAKTHSFSQISSINTRTPKIQPIFVITVGDPQKVGDPVRPFITYTVHTRTTSPLYRRSSFSVLRRYSDFLWLYETLSNNNPGAIVPPVPEKQQYGRFQDTFVENRRAALNKCIQKIANHPSLRDDPDLKLFLESDSFVLDIKHRKAEIAHERGGLMASIGNTLVGPRFYETDEWFDNKKTYLDSLESQLRGLVKSIDMVSKQRNEVALSMAEFAESVAALASCDMSKQLSHTLNILAEVQRKAKDLQDVQAREDVATIMSTVDEYARLVNSVRLAFTSRVRLYVSWQNADGDVRRAHQAYEKARRQGRISVDRPSNSLTEIAEAERRAMEAKQDFDNASKMIKSELARFEQERVEDFKNALMTFLDGMIARQKEIIHGWESYQESLLKRLGNPAPSAQESNSR